MSDYDTHAGGIATVIARLGTSAPVITWGNADYVIIPGSAVRRKDLAPGGFQLNADLKFDALVSTFASASIVDAASLEATLNRSKIQYLGDMYQVSRISILPGGLQVTVECTSLLQKA